MESFEDSETSKDMNGFLLIFKKNGFEGTTYSLPEGITTIGASINADIRIKLKDSRIEDIHCAIKVNKDGIATIINKANKHPIMVNNSIVNRARILRHEDFIEVVFKKFQYKNDFLTDQDIDAAIQKLLSTSNKTTILKKKSTIPRSLTERKPIIATKALPSSAASKRRLSLQVSDQSRIGTIGIKTPQLPHINIRRSSLNNGNCFRDSARKSLTRRSRNKIASDESENLRISSYSTCSPLEELSTSEADAENEVFVNQIQDKASSDCVIGNIASLEYLLVPTRKSSQNRSQIQTPGSRRSIKNPSTAGPDNYSSKDSDEYETEENVSLSRLSSARKSIQNRSKILMPDSRRSIKNQSTPGPDKSMSNATQGEESDESETEENIPPTRLSAARKSTQNRIPIQATGSGRSGKNLPAAGSDNFINNATQSDDCDESETEENVPPTRLSAARKSTQNRTPIQGTGSRRSAKNLSAAGPNNSTNNATQSEDSDESETEENVPPTSLSSARKSTQNRSHTQSTGSRRSAKNLSADGPDNSTNNATQSEDSDESETEENVPPTSLSSARKSTQNRSHTQSTGSRRSAKNLSAAGPDNSMNDSTQSEDSDESETEENVPPTSLSSARKSTQNRSHTQSTGSRRSAKNLSAAGPNNSTNNATQSEDSDESETEENVPPTSLSSARKSTQNRSHTQSTGSRRSAKNLSAAGPDNSMNDSTQSENSDEYETEENVPLSRLSSARKSIQNRLQIQTPGSRRSIKNQFTASLDNSMMENIDKTPRAVSDESESEENDSPTKLPSTRKSAQNISQIQTPGSRRSLKNLSAAGPDNSTNNATQSEDADESESEENVSLTKLSSARNSTQNRSHNQATGSRRSIKDQSIVGTDNSTIKNIDTTPSEDSDESKTEENVVPRRLWSARKSAENKSEIQTSDSRRSVENLPALIDLVSPIRMSTNVEIVFDTSVNNDSISTRASSSKKSLQNRSNIQTPRTKKSIDLSRSLFEQNLSPSKMSSIRKSKTNISSNRNNRTSKLVYFDINSSDVDDKNVNIRNQGLVELNPVNTSKSKGDNVTSAELISLSNLEADSTKRSSRKRKSTIKDDFFYGSFSTKSSNEDMVTTNKFDSTTIPLETYIDNVSVLTNDGELSVIKDLADNETCSTSYADNSANVTGKSTVNNSVVVLTTPISPVGRRKKYIPYQPITEDITPGTPVGTTESDDGFKTPLNTPHLFKSIRKSVLQTRQQRNSEKLAEKATKRPRESTSSISRSNKRIKLTINEDDTYEEQPSSFASFTSDDIFEEDDPHDIRAGTPKHIVELTQKPVVTYPTTKFSTEFRQKKTGAVRRSFPSTDQTIPKSTRRSLQITTLSSEDVGRTISESVPITKTRKLQKEPENDLTDVKGVKRLLSTPKVQNPPKNDLTDIPPIKKLLATPRKVKSPKNDLTEIPNLRKIMSPKQQNTPKNDLTDVRGVKKLMRTPAAQKQPRNDLSDLEGVSNMFNASVHHRLSNASDIENNEDLFNKIFNKKMLKTYRSKSTSPLKRFDAYGAVRKSVGDVPTINPRVSIWVNEQEELNKKVVEKPSRKGGKKGVEDVQCPMVSSTRRKERTNSETTDNAEDSYMKTRRKKVVLYKEDSPKPVRGRRNAIKQLKEVEDTATVESPKPVRGRRNANKKLEDIEDIKKIESPKPVRGRRNATKKIEVIEDTLDLPKPVRGRRNAIKKLEEIEDTMTDSPKPVRGRRKAVKKLEERDDTVTDSPKPVKGRRNANKKLEEIEDIVNIESPKPVRGRRNANKKIEEIDDAVTASPKPVGTRRNAAKNKEMRTEDSPKVSTRGRRKKNAIESENTVALNITNEENEKYVEERTKNSPVITRGRRNKRNVESVVEFEEKAVTGRNKRKTRKNGPVDSPTDSETEVEVRRDRKKTVNLKNRKVNDDSSEDVEEIYVEPKNKRVKVLKKVEEAVETSSPSNKAPRRRRNADVNEKDERSIEPANKTGSKKEVKKSTKDKKKEDSDVIESPQVSAKRSTRQRKVQFKF